MIVREPERKPKATAPVDVRAPRRKRMNDARETLETREKEGKPRNVVFARVQVSLGGSPDISRECVCGHQPWKWQDECPKCGAAMAA